MSEHLPVLEVESASVRYGGVRALARVDLCLGEGQLVGLIGPNGSGKTTFIDAVSGFVPCTGRVRLQGRDISGLKPETRARAGLARTFQAAAVFEDLTVRGNVEAAIPLPSRWTWAMELLTGRPIAMPAADRALDALGLGRFADMMPSQLTQAQRKLVGVARAIASGPHVVCLDEPAAGLDTSESQELGQTLRRLVDDGLSMLLVDHDMGLVLGVCDEVVVLEFGEVIARGDPESIRTNPRVIEMYLGSAAAEVASDISTAQSTATTGSDTK